MTEEAGRPKHIFICLDGTWRAAYTDMINSNVYRMTMALETETDDREEAQIFVYKAGVGTSARSSRMIAGALGDGLDQIVLDAYMNLVANYSPKDQIYIFGFSRGAFAACALASFLTRSSLLKANFSHLVGEAWKYFIGRPTGFQANISACTYDVKVRFLGLWDTVAGPRRERKYKTYRLNEGQLSSVVTTCVHILSMDETRRTFEPRLWNSCASDQTLEQVWLPGVHTDIGGGYQDSYLGTLSLLWMIDRLSHHCPDLLFDRKYIDEQWIQSFKSEAPVINDEWRWWLKPIRLLYHANRIMGRNPYGKELCHPIVPFMHEKIVMVKGTEKVYIPSVCGNPLSTGIPVATYQSDSIYAQLRQNISDRFGMPSNYVDPVKWSCAKVLA
jgi:uncharacterized protein (DUF2235 family)